METDRCSTSDIMVGIVRKTQKSTGILSYINLFLKGNADNKKIKKARG